MVRVKLKQLFDFLISSPTNGQVMMYNSTSQKWVNTTIPRHWSGFTTVAGTAGAFTITIPTGVFTAAPVVQATGRGTAAQTEAIFASITSVVYNANGSVTITGRANTSLATGILLGYTLTNAAAGTRIDISAIGS